MPLEGQAEVLRNLEQRIHRMQAAADAAADESALLLQNYARTHHGNTPRQAGFVYPGGWSISGKATKRWRPAGVGWGDVTGNLNNSIRGTSGRIPGGYRIVLSAGMEYAPFVELRWSGRWRWLWPALVANEKRILEIFRRHLQV